MKAIVVRAPGGPDVLELADVPDPVPAPVPARPAAHSHSAPVTAGPGFELVRSLERMEADLAEMRSEVERMKRYVHELHHTRSV